MLLWALQRKLRLSLSLPHSFRPLRPYSLDDDDDEDDDDDDDDEDDDDDDDDDEDDDADDNDDDDDDDYLTSSRNDCIFKLAGVKCDV